MTQIETVKDMINNSQSNSIKVIDHATHSLGGNRMFRLTESNKDIIHEYRRYMNHIKLKIGSIHGVLTKADTDQRDKLEAQLINCGLSRAMTTKDAEQALERLYREKERLQDAYKNIATTNYNARTE